MTGPALQDDVVDVRVLRGDPTPDELAALIAVIRAKAAAARAAGATSTSAPARSRWATYWRTAAGVPVQGRGAWQSGVR